MDKKYCMITTTTDDKNEADKIIDDLLEKRLVSCCQKINIESKYYWNGKKENANEILIIMKSKYSLYKRVEEEIMKIHSYEVPEITCVDIKDGLASYLKWIDDETI